MCGIDLKNPESRAKINHKKYIHKIDEFFDELKLTPQRPKIADL